MKVGGIRKFVEYDLWHMRLSREPMPRRLWLRMLRMVILTVRDFKKDKCTLRASALTFYTLMSIVPVLALAFGIAKGFGMDQRLAEIVRDNVAVVLPSGAGESGETIPVQDGIEEEVVGDITESDTSGEPSSQITEVVDRAIDFAVNMLEQTRGGVIAGIGVIFLLWTVIKLLSNIELAFNDVWLVKQPRTWARRFSDYLSLMIISPILFVVGMSAKGFVEVALNSEDSGWLLELVSGPAGVAIRFLPFFTITLLLTIVYIFMPNGKIKFVSALSGGFFAAILYNLLLQIFIQFQVGVSKAGAIYGSFAALPLFLTWVQLSWMIVLLGAEFAFAHQFSEVSEFEQDARRASPRFIKLTALSIVRECVQPFANGDPPLDAEEIAQRIGVPYQVVKDVLNRLVDAEVLSEVKRRRDREIAYQPAMDIEELRVNDVIERLENAGVDSIPHDKSEVRSRLVDSVRSFATATSDLDANKRLRDLI